jgi:hypothetical protein
MRPIVLSGGCTGALRTMTWCLSGFRSSHHLLGRRSMIIKVAQDRFLREFEEQRRVTERARAKVKGSRRWRAQWIRALG